MASNFGKTWWGGAWLNALSNIDYGNRIPRGASYARKGAVTGLNVKDNIIDAKVQGSRRTPYRVMIVLPKFMPEEIDRLIERIIARPAIISQLFQRELSPEIATIARDCGLKLFPERWSDLKMNCNCPDWAVPCKHLASVIYMLSREIDNNPFLIFEMHGVNLIKELSDRGVNLAENTKKAEPLATANIVEKSKPIKQKSKTQKSVSEEESEVASAYHRVDFSMLSPLSDSILLLLPDNPPFYVSGNFKEIYASQIARYHKAVDRFLNGRLAPEGFMPSVTLPVAIAPDTTAAIMLNDRFQNSVALRREESQEAVVDINALVQSLMALNSDFLPDYDISVAALHTALYAAIHFTANGLIKPEIIKVDKHAYRVIWTPLPSDANCSRIVEQINKMMPEKSLVFSEGAKTKEYQVNNRGFVAVSLFITSIIKAHSLLKPFEINRVTEVFFNGAVASFDGIGEKEVPGAIRTWTDRLVLNADLWRPVIYIADKTDDDDYFHLTIGIEGNESTAMGEETPLQVVVNAPEWEHSKFSVLKSVLRLDTVVPRLAEYINDECANPIELNDEEFAQFIINIIPAMRALGLKIFMPKSLQELLRPKASLHIMENQSEQGMFSIYDFFTYDWRIALGNDVVSPDEFKSMLAKAKGLIRFKQSYIYVSPADMEKLRERLNAPTRLSAVELFQAALSEEYDSAPVELSATVRKKIEEIRQYSEVEVPDNLHATLRPYQKRGYSWLYRNMKVGFGSILADDMGLGKTLQTIALIQKIKQDGLLSDAKTLVVAPVGLLYNWEAEIRRFAPSLTTFIYHGLGRDIKRAKEADVVLTSYGMARSDGAKLKKCRWALMVIDEAQNIKNPSTAQTKAINSFEADFRIALSGTPVENRLSEFWSIMHFVNKGYLGTLSEFNTNFAKPIQLFNDNRCANDLKKITAPFMLRRLKTDKSIINDLPDKIQRDVYSTLTPQQAALYEQTLSEAMAIIEGMPTDSPRALFKRQGIILQMILALKQICDHPALFLKNGDKDVALSGKALMLIDRVQEIVDANDKVIIFTQYREMGDMLTEMIERNVGHRPLFYHGGCSVTERKSMIDKFQNSRHHRIFILSLKAGGTGLNLTAANNVIHYDLWWNPAVESQATDRAYRIGQKRNVIVDRFITTGTFEEKINEMINSKRHLAEMTVSTGETWLGNLSNKELHEIFDKAH